MWGKPPSPQPWIPLRSETASNAFGATESYSIDQGPAKAIRYAGGLDGVPPPFPTLMIRGVAANAIPGRGPLNIGWSALGRFRDDMEGPPPRFGLKDAPLLRLSRLLVLGERDDRQIPRIVRVRTRRIGQRIPRPRLTSSRVELDLDLERIHGIRQLQLHHVDHKPDRPSRQEASNSNVMIWVDANTWTSDTSISSLLLSQGTSTSAPCFSTRTTSPK